MKGIPTLYNGIQFRSRLEAKWAAFFDLLAYDWEYEPFDLNGWILDFIIIPSFFRNWELKPLELLAEVKPFSDFTEFTSTTQKIMNSLKEEKYRAFILLGYKLNFSKDIPDLGWLVQKDHNALFGWKKSSAQVYSSPRKLQLLWKEAANKVQWKGKENG